MFEKLDISEIVVQPNGYDTITQYKEYLFMYM